MPKNHEDAWSLLRPRHLPVSLSQVSFATLHLFTVQSSSQCQLSKVSLRVTHCDFFWRDPQFVVAISSSPTTSIRTCTNLELAAGRALKDRKLETKENISRHLIKLDIWTQGAQFRLATNLAPTTRAHADDDFEAFTPEFHFVPGRPLKADSH